MPATDTEALGLIDEVLDSYCRANPVWATYAGVRDFDGALPDLRAEARQEWLEARKDFARRLKEVLEDGEGLSRDARLDLDFLKRQLEMEVSLEEATRPAERNPTLAPKSALYGLYFLTLRPFGDEGERAARLSERLRGVPALLEEGARQLVEPAEVPPLWVTVARQLVQGGDTFIAAVVPALASEAPSLASDLDRASAVARDSLEKYGRFLDKLAERAAGDFAVGEALFNSICQDFHGLGHRAGDLVAIGHDAIDQTKAALAEEARLIEAGEDWESVTERLQGDVVEPSEVLPLYRDQMERARRFVEERDLATIPEDERLEIVPTPPFARVIIPYAAYIPPGAFEADQTGYFWVTPVDEADPKVRSERLRGHCPTKAQVTALHEAYPGHHLQFTRANRLAWPVRKLFSSTVLVEGWALYCEELMYEEGFYTEPGVRFMELLGQLWRDCRVVIDASLHTRQMTPEQAVEMLVSVAKLSRPNAEAEVLRYTLSPTQPMSYHMGKRELLFLRTAYRQLLGDRFDLKAFHDKLLDFGSLPLPTIRDAMLEDARGLSSAGGVGVPA